MQDSQAAAKVLTEDEVKAAIDDAVAPGGGVAAAPTVAPPTVGVPDDAVAADAAKIKKKPGRPRKENLHIPIAVHGIVAQPIHAVDIVELIYSDPLLFKKYVALLKGYKVGEVELNFDKTGLRIDTKNRTNTADISAVISGACMNLYYCKEPIRLWVKRDSLEHVANALSKEHCRITWVMRENYREILYIVVKNSTYGSDQIFEVEVFSKGEVDAIPPAPVDDDSTYPVRFKISTKYFKKVITSVSKDSKQFVIQKNGAQPLQLTIKRAQGSNVGWTEVYPDGDKISLQSQIAEQDIFTVSVEIANILPFCKNALGDDIYVAADKERRISFQCFADRKEIGWTMSVRVFSNIVGTANPLLVQQHK